MRHHEPRSSSPTPWGAVRRAGRGRSFAAVVAAAAVGLAAAACGSSPSGSGTTSTTTKPASPASTTAATVKTAHTSLGVILVDSKGFTLYHFTLDHNGHSACNGACAKLWVPLTVASGTSPTGSGLSGTLGTITRSDGTTQVTYDGEPLYTYTVDTAPGSTAGQGVLHDWFVVLAKPSTTAPAASSSTTTTKASSGGYAGY